MVNDSSNSSSWSEIRHFLHNKINNSQESRTNFESSFDSEIVAARKSHIEKTCKKDGDHFSSTFTLPIPPPPYLSKSSIDKVDIEYAWMEHDRSRIGVIEKLYIEEAAKRQFNSLRHDTILTCKEVSEKYERDQQRIIDLESQMKRLIEQSRIQMKVIEESSKLISRQGEMIESMRKMMERTNNCIKIVEDKFRNAEKDKDMLISRLESLISIQFREIKNDLSNCNLSTFSQSLEQKLCQLHEQSDVNRKEVEQIVELKTDEVGHTLNKVMEKQCYQEKVSCRLEEQANQMGSKVGQIY